MNILATDDIGAADRWRPCPSWTGWNWPPSPACPSAPRTTRWNACGRRDWRTAFSTPVPSPPAPAAGTSPPRGAGLLARMDETPVDHLLRRLPVSAHWQRLLLERLDAVAVVYRLASGVAAAEGDFRFRWYRGAALDAAFMLPGGRTLGVIRQGAAADRTAFSERFRRLLYPREPVPRALLALMPDGARLRQDRGLLARYPGPVFLAREGVAASALAGDSVWHLTSGPAVLSLEEVLERLRPGGSLPVEPPLARRSPPRDLSIHKESERKPTGHLLPVVLKASHKGVLDRLGRVAPDHSRRPEIADRPFSFRLVPGHHTPGKAGPGDQGSGWEAAPA